MRFPVLVSVGPLEVHAHAVLEAMAYFVGLRLYLTPSASDAVRSRTRSSVLLGAALGAAAGSKLLYWLEWPADTWQHRFDLAWLLGGKTMVGALLGGWLGVEVAKARVGEVRSTGDRFVVPLAVGIAVGRVGCFLEGLDDHTQGGATQLPWGVDFGDGIFRHPTPLYEVLLLVLALPLLGRIPSTTQGIRFRVFCMVYFGGRLVLDALRPDPRWALGLTAIQWASLGGFALALTQTYRRSGARG